MINWNLEYISLHISRTDEVILCIQKNATNELDHLNYQSPALNHHLLISTKKHATLGQVNYK